MTKIAVAGAGAFGFAMAKHISDKIHDATDFHKGSSYDSVDYISLFDIDAELIHSIQEDRGQKYFFPEIKLNELVHATTDAADAFTDAQIVILSIPAQYIRSFLQKTHDYFAENVIFVNCSKGLEVSTDKFISEIVKEEMKKSYTYSVFSGGTIASEFISGFGVFGAELGCENHAVGKQIQQFLSSRKLRVYLNDDVAGVEAAGALKNVVSIAAGFMDGLGYPYGSKTLILSLAADEIRCLSLTLNSKHHTYDIQTQAFANDYIMSTTGNTRNRYLGELIGKGMAVEDAIEQMKKENKTAEGYYTARVVHDIIEKHNLDSPIMSMVYDVLYAKKDIKQCMDEIMSSDLEPIKRCGFAPE
jgi:glycerol-3-phosphate dehydrogenase (NAD(P)+)